MAFLKGNLVLLAQLDQDLERGHEGRNLGEAGPGDHGCVEDHPAGVVRGAQMRNKLMERIQGVGSQLENEN